MTVFSAQLHPNRALGFLALGASLHDILTRLKAEPQRFLKIDLIYSRDDPVHEPITIQLLSNGLRLQFDGPEQRLRLIEVVDFSKNHITYNDRDLVKPASVATTMDGEDIAPTGPSFRYVYNKFLGPTYPGEFIEDVQDQGFYVLSYPGVAFTFELPKALYSPEKDVVSLLSAAPNQIAKSMAVFQGTSWAAARETLWTEILPSTKYSLALPRGKDVCPDEISLVRIHGGGKLQLFKKWTSASSWITLGETTPQELVAELGPPDAIYRKNDQRMAIHKQLIGDSGGSNVATVTGNGSRTGNAERSEPRPTEDTTDTDQSSTLVTGSEDSDEEEPGEERAAGKISGECFYNYFFLGFDVLFSAPAPPSPVPPPTDSSSPSHHRTVGPPPASPSLASDLSQRSPTFAPNHLVATKVILHGNTPGSYEFNRHRRCRWDIGYLASEASPAPDSETKFSIIKDQLSHRWRAALADGEVPQWESGMVLNRGWGDDLGGSCELQLGWEDDSGSTGKNVPEKQDSTTTLYGLPGLVFEVLRNDYINAVTVF